MAAEENYPSKCLEMKNISKQKKKFSVFNKIVTKVEVF